MAESITVGILRALLTADTAEFSSGMRKAADSAKVFEKDWKRIGQQASNIGSALTKTITLPILGIGAGLLKVGTDFDNASDQIRSATGATGRSLDGLNASFKKVFATVPATVDATSTAIGDLHTRTGATGTALETLSTQMLNLARVGKADIGPLVATTTRAFGDWSISTDKQSAALDFLFKTSQATGIGVVRLTDLVVQFGAPMRALGFSFEQSAALMGKWEREGVNLETILSGLRFALGNFAKAGKEPEQALRDVQAAILGARTESEATAIAFQAFGKRAAVDMSRAIVEGRFNIDELVTSLKNSKETINSAAADTLSLGEKFQLMGNRVMVAVEPLATSFVQALERLIPALEPLMRGLDVLVQGFTGLPQPVQATAFGLLAVVAAAGPVVWWMGQLFTAASTAAGAFTAKGIATQGLRASYAAIIPWARAAWAAILGPVGLAVGAVVAIKALADALRAASGKTAAEIATWAGPSAVTGAQLNALAFGTKNVTQALSDMRPMASHGAAAVTGLGAAATAAGATVKSFADRVREKVAELRKSKDPIDEAAKAILAHEAATKKWRDETALASGGLALNLARWAALPPAIHDARAAIEAVRGAIAGATQNLDAMNLMMQATAVVPTQFMRGNLTAADRYGVTLGATVRGSLTDALSSMPQVVLGALQGGGNVVQSVGSLFGGSIAGAVSGSLSKAIGGTLGKMAGSIMGPLGSIAGSFVGQGLSKLFGGLFGGGQKQKVQESLAKLLEEAGGKKAFADLAKSAGVSDELLSRLFNATRLRDYDNALRQITGRMEAHNELLKNAQLLTDAQAQKQKLLNDAISRQKFAIEELGPALQRQNLAERAEQILDDWKLLTEAGIDVKAVTREMADEMSDFVNDARRTGVEVPDAMKPIIQSMLDQGLLLDENGQAFKDLESTGIVFGKTLVDMFKGVLEKLDLLIQRLDEAARPRRGSVTIDETVNVVRRDVTPGAPGEEGTGRGDQGGGASTEEHPEREPFRFHRGGLVRAFHAMGLPKFHDGGRVLPRHVPASFNIPPIFPGLVPGEVPAILQTGETVLSRDQTGALQRGATTSQAVTAADMFRLAMRDDSPFMVRLDKIERALGSDLERHMAWAFRAALVHSRP